MEAWAVRLPTDSPLFNLLSKKERKMANSSSSSSGIGVFGLLGVLFVGLKLTGHITWSWFWVTAPFWGGLLFIIAVIVVVGIIVAVCR